MYMMIILGVTKGKVNADKHNQMRAQRGTLLVYALGYVNSTKVIYRLALERKGVFRDVRVKANLGLMWSVSKWWRALE